MYEQEIILPDKRKDRDEQFTFFWDNLLRSYLHITCLVEYVGSLPSLHYTWKGFLAVNDRDQFDKPLISHGRYEDNIYLLETSSVIC